MFQNKFQGVKSSDSFNNYKWRIVLIRLHYFRTKNKIESHRNVCESKDFCNVVIPSEDTMILKFNQYYKGDKTSFTILEDLESLIGKIDRCKNNSKILIQQK